MASSEKQTPRPNGDFLRFRLIGAMMAKHPEICLISLVISLSICTKIGMSFHTKQILEPAKAPGRFFPLGSSVIDFPFGDIRPVAESMYREELLFVMYYAPWCAKSMQVRNEFQKAAKVMQNRIKFAAINCWYTEGACRTQYKFLMFPEIFLYHTHIGGFRYNGVTTADYMIKFIEDLMFPISFLHNKEEVKDFVARHDTSVIGYFDFNASPQPPGYTQFYYSALRMIEYDFNQPVKFAAISQKSLAEDFDLKSPGRLVIIRRSNYTMKYPFTANFTSSSIQKWIIDNQEEVREVALTYSHCSEKNIQDLVHVSIKDRQRLVQNHHDEQLSCQPNNTFDLLDKRCCVSIVTSQHHKSVCEYCKHLQSSKNNPCVFTTDSNIAQELTFGSVQAPSCIESVQNYNVNEHRSICCKKCNFDLLKNQKCSSRRKTDFFVLNGEYMYRNSICRKLTLQKLQRLVLPSQSISPSDTDEIYPVNFTGLKCRTNKTVNFYVLDVVHHGIFADRLEPGLSTEFVVNYTSTVAPRHLRSETKTSNCDILKGDNTCLIDVTSASFQSIDVVLFVYAPWCGFCASIAHLYISLAKYFKAAKNILFTRINADSNDLPWEYTVEDYPTILFFPAYRKADSVMFPETTPKTLPNLIKFVMNHATHDLRMDTAVYVCSKYCRKRNLENSIYLIHTLRRRNMVTRQRIKHLSTSLTSDDINNGGQKYSHRRTVNVLTQKLQKLEKQLHYATLLKKYLLKHYNENFSKSEFSRFLNQHKMTPDINVKNTLHDELTLSSYSQNKFNYSMSLK
ncbi:hypothetical protein KUTeg_004341 [Tegillarca granosa]|uniref:Thioredoxin domain-containing protein n=1 Tax=Tegillarca granosa TaxID=220873 RepID=A0ABQ9FPR7_TEGGR|nr:hypothetical protein KUTeg_004341 [Tegillarca granosa]